MSKDVNVEELESELDDDYSDDSLFNIVSWGADLSFRELLNMYEDNELVKPELQRKYVWSKDEASRFVESILLGLPVPSIFLAKSGSQKLIVDGYQRIMTIHDYIKGNFCDDRKEFKLSNKTLINERWRNKSFKELGIDDQRKIKSTTIHAIIFEQKNPANDDTSMYQIFERINTGGRTLKSQEIRNCVYQGRLNSLLFELNEYGNWRKLYGSNVADTRMRDIEYILRFFVIKTDEVLKSSTTQISLKKELNNYMSIHRNDTDDFLSRLKSEFKDTVDYVYERIGENAFRNLTSKGFSKKFHPAIFDAVMVAAYLSLNNKINEKITQDCHKNMFNSPDFKNAISKRTTNVLNINARINIAKAELFGIQCYEK